MQMRWKIILHRYMSLKHYRLEEEMLLRVVMSRVTKLKHKYAEKELPVKSAIQHNPTSHSSNNAFLRFISDKTESFCLLLSGESQTLHFAELTISPVFP